MSSSFHLCDDHQIQNPISKQEDSSSSPFLSNFPSPFFDKHHELPLNQIFPHQYHHHRHLMAENHCVAADQSQKNSDHCSTEKEKGNCTTVNGVSKLKGKASDLQPLVISTNGSKRRNIGVGPPKKRTGKKDRHSKIRTAQGIRDRRMRLSLQAARKFFDLQDMLGYDKASKTIEWLFSKSKKAIKEIMINKDNPQRNYSLSINDDNAKREVEVSGIEENFSNNHEVEKLGLITPAKSEKLSVCKSNARESRDKARARARCRTREKMMIKLGLENLSQLCCKISSPNDILEKLGSCSNSPLFDQERVSSYGGDDHNPSNLLVSPKLADDVGTIEKLLENSNSSSTIHCCESAGVSCFTNHDSNFMGFFGNWDLFMNNERLNNLNNELYAVVTNEVPFGGSPNSVYSSAETTPDFQLFHQ